MTNFVTYAAYFDNELSLDSSGLPNEPSGLLNSLSFYFTSKAELERLFSSLGIEYRRDDFADYPSEYTKVLLEIISQATYEVKAILNKLFEDSDLFRSIWVRRRATIIGCYLFSIRRGNDSQYYNEYLDALADLNDLLEGKLYLEELPSGPGTRVGFYNISTDNRRPAHSVRVDSVTSSDLLGVKFPQWYRPYLWF